METDSMLETKKLEAMGKAKPKAKDAPLPGVAALMAQAVPVSPLPPGMLGMAAAAIDSADELAGINVARDAPPRRARLHLRLAHHHEHRPTLVSQGDQFLAWNGRSWHDVTAEVNPALFRTAR